MEAQKQQHDAKLITTKEEEKLKMDKMALELELKWTETLRWRAHVFGFLEMCFQKYLLTPMVYLGTKSEYGDKPVHWILSYEKEKKN